MQLSIPSKVVANVQTDVKAIERWREALPFGNMVRPGVMEIIGPDRGCRTAICRMLASSAMKSGNRITSIVQEDVANGFWLDVTAHQSTALVSSVQVYPNLSTPGADGLYAMTRHFIDAFRDAASGDVILLDGISIALPCIQILRSAEKKGLTVIVAGKNPTPLFAEHDLLILQGLRWIAEAMLARFPESLIEEAGTLEAGHGFLSRRDRGRQDASRVEFVLPCL